MAASQGTVHQVQLRRNETSQSWGFRLRGGVDTDLPLHVEGVAKNGRAMQAGMKPGDLVIAICGQNVMKLTHDQVKTEILRAGNDLDITLHRGLFDLKNVQPATAGRVEIVEEPTSKMGGPTFKPIQPKTYQVLEDELAASQETEAPPKPASIFNRKKEERSGYLNAAGPSIQKAYGEKY